LVTLLLFAGAMLVGMVPVSVVGPMRIRKVEVPPVAPLVRMPPALIRKLAPAWSEFAGRDTDATTVSVLAIARWVVAAAFAPSVPMRLPPEMSRPVPGLSPSSPARAELRPRSRLVAGTFCILA
jgi:hypothetical protein